jgi:serine/threonine-protein kinase
MIGQVIAHFRVTEKLAAGGMGEVYRATDSRLGRDVALKILPEAFASDPQRMARFEREAQLLAALNHPHIATIHGLEVAGATRALVMELVEGSTLADRIAQGPMPLEDVLLIAGQMAEALEYAHDRGIIHRDLKPANVKVTRDGSVKLLDFGLAKALEELPAAADSYNSPTISAVATRAGIILGTAAYMSPEQAEGKPADRRVDIWAFGAVLYEMLSGKRLFGAHTAPETLALVLTQEPKWDALPATVPQRIRRLLERCLTKDPKQRLRDIGEARIAIAGFLAHPGEDAESTVSAGAAPSAAQPLWRRALPWAVAATCAILATIGFFRLWSRSAESGTSFPVRISGDVGAARTFFWIMDRQSSSRPTGRASPLRSGMPPGNGRFISAPSIKCKPLRSRAQKEDAIHSFLPTANGSAASPGAS